MFFQVIVSVVESFINENAIRIFCKFFSYLFDVIDLG